MLYKHMWYALFTHILHACFCTHFGCSHTRGLCVFCVRILHLTGTVCTCTVCASHNSLSRCSGEYTLHVHVCADRFLLRGYWPYCAALPGLMYTCVHVHVPRLMACVGSPQQVHEPAHVTINSKQRCSWQSPNSCACTCICDW